MFQSPGFLLIVSPVSEFHTMYLCTYQFTIFLIMFLYLTFPLWNIEKVYNLKLETFRFDS